MPEPQPLFACLYRPPGNHGGHGVHGEDSGSASVSPVLCVASAFSPRYERHRDDLVSIDISGLGRLLGPPRAIGEELRRDAASRGLRVHIAIARTRTAAMILALARPGLTVVDDGGEAQALASIGIGILDGVKSRVSSLTDLPLAAFRHWGLTTLGELAALPSADLAARLGMQGLVWQAIARGDDGRPLVPDVAEEPFASTLDLEWPIEGLEPLSFVLTRLLEPIVTRLERRDRGVAVLHVELRLSGSPPPTHVRRLDLPTPIRDVRTLRTLALLDLESHPPPAAIERVTVRADPTPARIVQHTLFTRAVPTPEQLSTLVARLNALMGADRIGAPAEMDTYRPGAFGMTPFAAHASASSVDSRPRRGADPVGGPEAFVAAPHVVSALRRCRQPVPARVAVADGRPVRVTTDRRGFAGGAVVQCAGPWRTSGEWWTFGDRVVPARSGTSGEPGRETAQAFLTAPAAQTSQASQACPARESYWHRDEWDVALSDGAIYRIFQDRDTDAWFIDAVVD